MRQRTRALSVRALLAVCVLTCGTASAQEARRPLNILLIAVDDLRTELGCFGVEYARTPSIDRLAAEGVLFTNHFVAVPTCGASRYALLTGRSPRQSGVRGGNSALYEGNTAIRAEVQVGAQTMPELFRRSGYHTVCLGKISHTPDGRVFAYDGEGDGRAELPHAWDELATPFGPWKRGWGAFFAYAEGRHREDGRKHRDLMEFVVQRDEELPDGLIAREAVAQLEALRDRDEPFFLGVGFYKPHLPFVATQGDWEAMAEVDVPAPPAPDKPDSNYWHKSGEFRGYNAPFPETRPLATADSLRARRAYLACARFVDRQVGKVLAAVDELGLRENTIVVLWGDHGWMLGDSELWGKHSPHERALHSPLIIRAPGVSKAGLRSAALVETTDLYPTLLDLAAPSFSKVHEPLDGVSLKPLLDGSKDSMRAVAVSYWGSATSLRTRTHRLIFRGEPGSPMDVELYAMDNGPDPLHNMAQEAPKLVERLLGLLTVQQER